MHIFGNDSGLVRLGHISEDYVDHAHQKSIVMGLAGVVDDWDDVGPLLGHVDQVSPDSVRKLDSIDYSGWTQDI